MKIYFFIGLMLMNLMGICQNDFKWWNDKHNYIEGTHWTDYLIYSPAFLGPNALPVPMAKNGLIQSNSSLDISYESHFSSGENAYNLHSELFLQIIPNFVGINMHVVPLEYYEIDTTTRDERKLRDYDGKGFSGGDIYVGTYIQLIRDKKNLPDILISANIRTASGTNLSAGRFTDTPGYFFDISLGKDYKLKSKTINTVRPYFLSGFYVWQTNLNDNRQNDALMYGSGVKLSGEKISWDNYLGGYFGYLNNGDRPLVFRSTFIGLLNSTVQYKIMFQQGLIDYNYTTIRVGCSINLNKIKINRLTKKSPIITNEGNFS